MYSSYLSIPSFKWYRAAGLSKGRMSHTCQAYGRQILGVGGRQSYVGRSDPKAGCYKTPTFLYDAQSELVRNNFDVSLRREPIVPCTNFAARPTELFHSLQHSGRYPKLSDPLSMGQPFTSFSLHRWSEQQTEH